MRHTTLRPSFLAAAFVALLALSGCAGTVADGSDDETAQGGADIRGEWRFDGGTNAGSDIAVGDFPVTMVFSNGNARVRTGCFSFDQPMTSDLDVVTASYVSPPQASCVALDADVDAAIKSLDKVTGADRNDDLLTLTGDDLELEFTLVPAAAADDVTGSWALGSVRMSDTAISPLGEGPAIEFTADGAVSGSTGCADFTGTTELVSGLNVVTDLEYVEGMCTAEETQTMIDSTIREVLDNGFLVHAGDGVLSLVSSKSDSTLVYSPKV